MWYKLGHYRGVGNSWYILKILDIKYDYFKYLLYIIIEFYIKI